MRFSVGAGIDRSTGGGFDLFQVSEGRNLVSPAIWEGHGDFEIATEGLGIGAHSAELAVPSAFEL